MVATTAAATTGPTTATTVTCESLILNQITCIINGIVRVHVDRESNVLGMLLLCPTTTTTGATNHRLRR